jgi:hypothetical protein
MAWLALCSVHVGARWMNEYNECEDSEYIPGSPCKKQAFAAVTQGFDNTLHMQAITNEEREAIIEWMKT